MLVETLVLTVVAFLIAFGLAYWAYRARGDRSAFVGLYLLFGFPATLLLVAGGAVLAAGDGRLAALLLLLAVGFGLPLLRPFRRALAAVTPMDAGSPVDMAGLCLLLPTLALVGYTSFGNLPTPDEIPAVGFVDIAVNLVAFVVLAYVAVGVRIVRSFPEATARLGINRPSWVAIGAAVGCGLLGLVVQSVVGFFAVLLQPEVIAELDRVTEQITAQLQNPIGAAAVGIGAGVGEELFFRGAIQPRYGNVLTSVAFALFHAPQYGLNVAVVGLFLVSMLFGLLRARFGTTAAMTAHAVYNFIVVMLQVVATS